MKKDSYVKIPIYLFTALLGFLSTFIVDFKKENRLSLESYAETISQELLNQKYLNDSLIVRLNKSQKDLGQALYIVNSQISSPFATWQKNSSGTMMSLNDVYEDVFLKPRGIQRYQYLGFKDKDIWPKDIAEEFETSDKIVLETGKIWKGYGTVIIKNRRIRWRVIKWPIYDSKGISIVGVAGMALPEDWIPTTVEPKG